LYIALPSQVHLYPSPTEAPVVLPSKLLKRAKLDSNEVEKSGLLALGQVYGSESAGEEEEEEGEIKETSLTSVNTSLSNPEEGPQQEEEGEAIEINMAAFATSLSRDLSSYNC
jgi:hypothetical protein